MKVNVNSKKMITVMILMVAVVISLCTVPTKVFAETPIISSGYCGVEKESDAIYTLDSNGLLMIRGTGAIQLSNLNVQLIKNVVIENGITSIGQDAFSKCVNLQSIFIPASVMHIGYNCFDSCSTLLAINVDQANQYYTSVDGVLFTKNKSVLIQYPNGKTAVTYTIPNETTSIEVNAFKDCPYLTSVIIPDTVTKICSQAFYNCTGLTSITLSSNVTAIEAGTFSNCSHLFSITLPRNILSIDKTAFTNCPTVIIYGYLGSFAEQYAKDNSIAFKYLIDAASIQLSGSVFVATGSEIKPVVVIPGLVQDKDFTVSYSNNIGAGNAIITITGIGNYTGTVSKEFLIIPTSGVVATPTPTPVVTPNIPNPGPGHLPVPPHAQKLKAKLSGKSFYFTGSEIRPDVTVPGLVLGQDFIVTYQNNILVGKATVVITGIGNYSGKSDTKHFDINPVSSVQILNIVPVGKKDVTLTWTKDEKMSGYEIRYSTDPEFKQKPKAKTKVIRSNETSANIKGLKEGTVYYFQVRALQAVGGKYYASNWSESKFICTAQKEPKMHAPKKLKNDKLKLTWGKDAFASGYFIMYSPTRNFAPSNSFVVDASSPKITISNLAPGTTYYIKVCSYINVDDEAVLNGFWSPAKKVKM